jgi:hypothetical protein
MDNFVNRHDGHIISGYSGQTEEAKVNSAEII